MKPIVICGPTASGKTELALELAKRTDGIIISADSRQVYTHLTAGTAKPQGVWQNGAYWVEGVPYHLVDFLNVTDTFNAGAFVARAREITAQYPGRQIIFAGGTGMYLHAYFVGMDTLPASIPQTRELLTRLLEEEGKEGLHARLAEKDPASAATIPAGNVQRTMRALELCLLTGKPASQLRTGVFHTLPNPAQSAFVYLNWDKDSLHARIQTRTQAIFDPMCQETQALLNQGTPADVPALKSLGYPQAVAYLQGQLTRTQAVEQIALLTRQYAKRQRTWFNRYTQALVLGLQTPQDFDLKKISEQIFQFVSQNNIN